MPAISGLVSSFPYQNLTISSVPPHRAATTHASRIADLTTAHYHFIPIKHRSYPNTNTVNYYLDSTNYRLSKTKTIKLTQRLAEFSCMLAFHTRSSQSNAPAASSTSTASRRA